MGLKRRVKEARAALKALKLAARRHGCSLSALSATGRFLRLSRQSGYEPVEAFRLGFFDPHFDTNQLRTFLSRKHSTRLQEVLNPPTLAGLFKNKIAFYQRCYIEQLPIPRIFAIFSVLGKAIHAPHSGAWVAIDEKKLFGDTLPSRFAVKPAVGSFGDGFKIITRQEDGFEDHNSIFYSPSAFLRLLRKTSPVGTLMQEVVANHPDITSFSGAEGLQTIRITTLVGTDGRVEILTAFLKTISQKNIVADTHMEKLKGNLEVLIDLSTGSLCEASYLDGTGKGITVLSNHPISGKPFDGFIIPYWSQVLELANRAALMALPVRTIGWDIGVSGRGPCLIEGNIWWNPPNQHRLMGRMAERLRSVIAELSQENCQKVE